MSKLLQINKSITDSAIELLKKLIATESLSRKEDKTADLIQSFFEKKGITVERIYNNIIARSKQWRANQPTILLNSHHDTVKPASGYTKNPFNPEVTNGILYGLGSNDAGGSLVALIATFLHLYERIDLGYNLIFVASAEEEISGPNGIAAVRDKIAPIDLGIIGEPTQMRMAIAEKGLMVVDGEAIGQSGHAAREEGINAIYIALKDIDWIKNYEFKKVSDVLGKTKMTVSQIQAGTQHNVVPDCCKFVIDIRTNEEYANEEVFNFLQKNTASKLKARSFRLNSSKIALSHPIVRKGLQLGLPYYGSPTLSDQALLPFTTIKIGCGKSERSHTADEFIYLSEIREGTKIYLQLLEGLIL
ncbi:MAG: M20 family metallo-hydrolase [Bacteroidota bacterium]